MRRLLNTQVMLWWLLDDPRLRAATRDLMASTAWVVSVASIWEVAIKHQLGKLPVAPDVFRSECVAARASIRPILEKHVIETSQRPPLHDDPFDLLLIAQARVEGFLALSANARWPGYPVSLQRA
jgi:PIN domain nuclease of toxin-antitoxin system